MTDTEEDDDLPVVVEHPGEIRKLQFSNSQINESLDRQLKGVPADAKMAFVATAYKENGRIVTRMAVYGNKYNVLKEGDELSFGGFIAGDVKHPLDTIGAEVRYVMK